MELIQAEEYSLAKQAGGRIAMVLERLSQRSLAVGVALLPWRYAWVFLSRPQPPLYGAYTSLSLYLSTLPFYLTVIAWLLSLAIKPRRIALKPYSLTVALLGLILVALISTISSADTPVTLYRSITLVMFFGLYLYLVNEVRSFSALWAPAALGVLIQVVVVFGQIIRQHSLGLASLQELPLDPAWNGVSIVLSAGTRTLRAYGLSDHPNILGGCLAFAMIVLMAGFLRTHGARRLFSAVAFVLSGLALLLTFSRAAWLGLAAGLGLVGAWLLITRRSLALLSWAGLCAVSLILMVPLILQYASFLSSRLNLDGSFSAATPENQSVNERWLLLSQAGRLIAAHPLTGVGAGAYPQALRQAEPDYPFAYQPPHMVLAEVTAETGLPGGTLYLSALALPWVLLARGRKTLAFTLSLACASALLLALSVVSFLDYYPWLSSAGSAWQWLAWGAWGGIFAGLPGKGAV